MEKSIEVLVGLIAVKELEIRMLKERITQLSKSVLALEKENDYYYKIIEAINQEKEKKAHEVGFKQKGE